MCFQRFTVHFAKSFFNMSENDLLVKAIRRQHRVRINHRFDIPLNELTVEDKRGETFRVPMPTGSKEGDSLSARLISNVMTPRMDRTNCNCVCFCRCDLVKPAETVVLHLHGGGFIAQTSKSHETYLLQWAKNLNVPVSLNSKRLLVLMKTLVWDNERGNRGYCLGL